jgi:hypothetical protein
MRRLHPRSAVVVDPGPQVVHCNKEDVLLGLRKSACGEEHAEEESEFGTLHNRESGECSAKPRGATINSIEVFCSRSGIDGYLENL